MSGKRLVVTIGDKLRSAREKLGKTQLEVAVAAGLRPEVISRLENNKTGASLASLHKLTPVLGLSIDEIVRNQPAATGTSPRPPGAASAARPSVKKAAGPSATSASAKKPTKGR